MTEYIETESKSGAIIRIEVGADAKGSAGFGRQAGSTDVSNEAVKDAYDQILTTVRACADGMMDTIQGLETQPSAASIEFALKVDAKAGAMIAKSMGDAHFKVSLSWKQGESDSEKEKDSA
jgi:hypothetical protein